MSNYYHLPVVGIDVAANFSIVTALKPDGDIYQKNLRIEHSLAGFNKLLLFLQKIEEEFNDSPRVFCESTGIYHLTLLHFLINNQIDIRVINPLITNSNKNSNIRKVKNDKLDSLSIAKICKFDNVKTSSFTSEEFLHLHFLNLKLIVLAKAMLSIHLNLKAFLMKSMITSITLLLVMLLNVISSF